jgi:serine/threonine protein kinase
MADVYRATDQNLGRDVAVKLLRDRTPDPTDRARFVAEAQTLARLNHPNLVTILDAGISDEHPFLVLELVVGPSLSVALGAGGQGLSVERVSHIGAQIAAALAHCHAAGIVHRDVKPGNILLGSDDRALLTDFGISRLLDASAEHTQTGFTIGTASYLAPEQVRGDHVTPAVDLYALGLVLLEAITGRREYTGAPVEAAIARLHRSPTVPGDLPRWLSTLLTALTRTDPVLRPDAVHTAAVLTAGPSTDEATGLAPVAPRPPHATDPLDVVTAEHKPARLADAAVLANPEAARSAPSSRAAPPARRGRRPALFALLGWAAAAAAVGALLLTVRGAPPSPSTPPTGSTESTSTPAKPVRTDPSPSTGVTPAPNVSPATATTHSTNAAPHAGLTRDRTGTRTQTTSTTPGRTKPAKAKQPVKSAKGHHKAKPKTQPRTGLKPRPGGKG